MKRLFSAFIVSVLLTVCSSAADAQQPATALPSPTVRPAIDGILAGFQNHPLVAIGNNEDYAQEEDFYAALVRDPRFARDVGNVVVEFGSSAHQDIMDRYLNGGDVPFSELRKVWSDVVGFNIPFALGYINFFAAVRDVNHALPPGQRIHVWLGEPPIDWSKIKSQDEFVKHFPERDAHPAEILEKQILAQHKKALIIYGDGHYYDHDGRPSMLSLVGQKYPNSVYIVEMYTGFATKACTDGFEQTVRGWQAPVVVTPVKASSLEGEMHRPDCHILSLDKIHFPPSFTQAQKSQIIDEVERDLAGLNADALLYLGKAASLTQSPYEPSIYLDAAYLREMNRREKLGFEFALDGAPLGHVPLTDSFVQKNPASPQYIHHY